MELRRLAETWTGWRNADVIAAYADLPSEDLETAVVIVS
jgi:hypothetical protein